MWRVSLVPDAEPAALFTKTISTRFHQPPAGFGEIRMEWRDAFHQSLSQVGLVTAGVLIFQSRGRLTALEPATGRQIWSRSQLPPAARIVGDAEFLVMIHQEDSQVSVFRTLDGRQVGQWNLPASHLILDWEGRRALLQKSSKNSETFSTWDAATNRVLWEQNTPAKTIAFGVDSKLWGFLTPTGELSLVERIRGRVLSTTLLPAVQNPSQVHVAKDADQIYLAITHPEQAGKATGEMPFLELHRPRHRVFAGSLHAFDQRTGKALWQSAWGWRAFPLDQPLQGPLLVLFHREGDTRARPI